MRLLGGSGLTDSRATFCHLLVESQRVKEDKGEEKLCEKAVLAMGRCGFFAEECENLQTVRFMHMFLLCG